MEATLETSAGDAAVATTTGAELTKGTKAPRTDRGRRTLRTLLDAVVDYLPSPLDVPSVQGVDPKTGEELTRPAAFDAPFSALVFKVMSDPFVGKLTYFRVYSGQITAGDRVVNQDHFLVQKAFLIAKNFHTQRDRLLVVGKCRQPDQQVIGPLRHEDPDIHSADRRSL